MITLFYSFFKLLLMGYKVNFKGPGGHSLMQCIRMEPDSLVIKESGHHCGHHGVGQAGRNLIFTGSRKKI
jgi:hypothetical protein